MRLDTIVCGDCLDVMRDMPDGCVDVVITDPPYGLDFPYPAYDDTRENLISLISSFLPQARRLASRVIILCGPTQIGLYPQVKWVSCITWNTTGSFGKYGYNQWTPILCYGPDVPGFGNVNGVTKTDALHISGGAGVGFMRTKEEKKHTCPKPITLMEKVVNRFSSSGNLVFDPFIGSGTTAVAALKLGRHFYGCDISPEYVERANQRIETARQELSQLELAL